MKKTLFNSQRLQTPINLYNAARKISLLFAFISFFSCLYTCAATSPQKVNVAGLKRKFEPLICTDSVLRMNEAGQLIKQVKSQNTDDFLP